jgi:hypothetical protein
MLVKKIWRYLADHWQGRQGFAWSFWVNLVFLRAVVVFAQEWLRPAKGGDYSAQTPLVLGLAFLFHGVVFVWQVVGVLRAGEAHIRDRGAMAIAWGAQLGAVIAFWLTASYAFESWQMTLPVPGEDNFLERMDREHASKYLIEVSVDGRTLTISGTIELGITRNLARWLEQYPETRTIALNSHGGNIYEARGLSKLVRNRQLDTLVEEQCISACTTVFIGGKHRSLKRNARLGFHQYRIDADYHVLIADPAAEQERDRELYAASNVEPWFLAKMFERGAADMWFPAIEELVGAGVVNEISD